jgi:predicted nucleotidyltransferase
METLLKKRRKILHLRRYDEAWKKLRKALDYLNREGAKEVFLFGSIINPEKFTEHSDVDLAVRGIAEEKHLEIEGKLEDILGDLEYDILFLEEEKYLRKEILKRIREEAVLWKPSS